MKDIKVNKDSHTLKTSDSINKYFQEIGKMELLSKEEENELAKILRETNDKKLIDKLINSNLRFVVTVAKQFQGLGLELEDLINEGNIGMIIAANKFDERKGFKFISYAVWWIRQSILQALSDNSRMVRIPVNQIGNISKINKAILDLEQKFGRNPTNDEISELLDIKTKKIDDIMSISGKCDSLYSSLREINKGYTDNTLIDVIENENSNSPDDILIKDSVINEINMSLNILSEREIGIVEMFFGLNGETSMTLESIGEKFNLTKERVRQIKDRCIRKLRYSILKRKKYENNVGGIFH